MSPWRKWFDSLHPRKKRNLQYQSVDVAEEIYYELEWRHRKLRRFINIQMMVVLKTKLKNLMIHIMYLI